VGSKQASPITPSRSPPKAPPRKRRLIDLGSPSDPSSDSAPEDKDKGRGGRGGEGGNRQRLQEELQGGRAERELARGFERAAGAREYGDGDFIMGEGRGNARKLTRETKEAIRRLGLAGLDRKARARRVEGLLRDFEGQLEEYRERLDGRLTELCWQADEVRRGKSDEELLAAMREGMGAVTQEMLAFTRVTDDVLVYCLGRRAKERLENLVDDFIERHREVDQVAKDTLKEVGSDLRRAMRRAAAAAGGMGSDCSLSAEEESVGEEEEETKDEEDEERLDREGDSDYDRYAEGRRGGSPGPPRRARGKRRRRRRGSRRRDAREDQDADSLDDFIVDDIGVLKEARRARKGRKRRRVVEADSEDEGEEGARGGGGRQNRSTGPREGARDVIEVDDDESGDLSSSTGEEEARAPRKPVRDRRAGSGAARVQRRERGSRQHEEAGREEGAGPAQDGHAAALHLERGEDIEALARGEGEAEAEGPQALEPPAGFDARPCRDPLAGQDGASVEVLGGLRLALDRSWLLEPAQLRTCEPSAALRPELFARLHCLAAAPGQQLPLPMLAGALEAVSKHLKRRGLEYSSAEVERWLEPSLRAHALQLEALLCPDGLGGCTAGAVLYWYMLDWAATLARLHPSGSGGAFASGLALYVLQQLVGLYVDTGKGLRLNLGGPDPFAALSATPLSALWLQVYRTAGALSRCGASPRAFWELLHHAVSSRVLHLGDDWLGQMQQALRDGSLSVLVACAGPGSMRALDPSQAESVWMLVLELVRLEALASRLPEQANQGGPDTQPRAACWALVEGLLTAPPLSLDLGGTGAAPTSLRADSHKAPSLPPEQRDQYMVPVLERLRVLMGAWRPDGQLVARLWSTLLRSSAARLERSPPPRPVFSTWSWLQESLNRPLVLASGPWRRARDLFWSLTHPSYCPLPHYLFLPPPEHLRDLPEPGAVAELVSRGCDQVLLLASCLLERHMCSLGSAEERRRFLLQDLLASVGGEQRQRLLGLHSLAMVVLLLAERGQADQRVLLNFWRRLKELYPAKRAEGYEELPPSWALGAALAIQFLAHLEPSTHADPDFLHASSMLDALKEWLAAVLPRLPAVGSVRNPPLEWTCVLGTALLHEMAARFDMGADMQAVAGRAVLRYRELADAPLSLVLQVYELGCPLGTAPAPLADSPLLTALPGMPRLLERRKGVLDPAGQPREVLAGQRQPVGRGGGGATVRREEATDVLTALMSMVKEAWQSASATAEVLAVGDRQEAAGTTQRRWHRHAVAALRALAAALASGRAGGVRDLPPLAILAASLDSDPATFRDPRCATLRLLGPALFDAHMAFDPSPRLSMPLGRGRHADEWDALACWVSLTLEASSWPSSGGTQVRAHVWRQYWALTARLVGVFGATVLDVAALGRDVALPEEGRLRRMTTSEHEAVLRLGMLAVLAVWVAREHALQRPHAHTIRALCFVKGALPMLADTTRGSRPGARLAYAVASLLLRVCREALPEDLLSKLVPALFGPWVGPSPSGGHAAVDTRLAADHLADLLRYVSQNKYGGGQLQAWLRHLVRKDGGLLAPAAPEQRPLKWRAMESVSHGLWHLCACEVPEGASTLGKALRGVAALTEGAEVLQRLEGDMARKLLDGFRWRLVASMDLPAALQQPSSAGAALGFLRRHLRAACVCGRAACLACPLNDLAPLLSPVARLLLATASEPSGAALLAEVVEVAAAIMRRAVQPSGLSMARWAEQTVVAAQGPGLGQGAPAGPLSEVQHRVAQLCEAWMEVVVLAVAMHAGVLGPGEEGQLRSALREACERAQRLDREVKEVKAARRMEVGGIWPVPQSKLMAQAQAQGAYELGGVRVGGSHGAEVGRACGELVGVVVQNVQSDRHTAAWRMAVSVLSRL
jgi:hypothetical protein